MFIPLSEDKAICLIDVIAYNILIEQVIEVSLKIKPFVFNA